KQMANLHSLIATRSAPVGAIVGPTVGAAAVESVSAAAMDSTEDASAEGSTDGSSMTRSTHPWVENLKKKKVSCSEYCGGCCYGY
ncbi:hypothetical protein SK128_010455, partial [Halocaridina rubra]